jgi:hypothetical protein
MDMINSRGDGTNQKKERINQIIRILTSVGETDLNHAKALIEFNIGVSAKKADEYLKLLAEIDVIKIENNVITVNPIL